MEDAHTLEPGSSSSAQRRVLDRWRRPPAVGAAEVRSRGDDFGDPVEYRCIELLVGDLSIRDAQFRQWWAGSHVAAKRRGTRRYNHPVVGEITLDWDSLTSDAEPDPQLIVYTAEPGSRSEQALRELSAWAAEHIRTPR